MALSDHAVAATISKVVAVGMPTIDGLARVDPLELKGRERALDQGVGAKVLDTASWLVNALDVPGTAAWTEKDTEHRIRWWVRRVGSLNNVIVAAPGVFGVLADRVPVQDLLGFANQSLILCAVGREYGVSQDVIVAMIGKVLCGRELSGGAGFDKADVATVAPREGSAAVRLGKSLWRMARLLRDISGELGKRPSARLPYRMLGKLPVVGVAGDYFGELGALSRAAKAGRRYLDQRGYQATPVPS